VKKLSDFHEILYTEADFELEERHVIKNEKVALDRLRVRQNVFLVSLYYNYYPIILLGCKSRLHGMPSAWATFVKLVAYSYSDIRIFVHILWNAKHI